jgi:hypothetical protein
MQNVFKTCSLALLAPVLLIFIFGVPLAAKGAETSDTLLDIMIKKGLLTEAEAKSIKAEADASRTNRQGYIPQSQWKMDNAITNMELFGDIRVRYEYRQADTPAFERIGLERARYALRIGLRGQAYDDFYYGIRLETASNPRSPWVTFGTASTSSTGQYLGPFGKSTAGINVGQIYLGWHPEDWVDVTVGKMPNPLYTTSMLWDTDLSPEGAAERFKYTVGNADFFANFGQFLYADLNPDSASGGLGFNGLVGQSENQVFQIAWQGGLIYHITTNLSVKAAGTLYNYIGLGGMGDGSPGNSPFFNGPYIGEGAYIGPGGGIVNGSAGAGVSSALPAIPSAGYPLNQVGLNHLLVVDIPFQIDYKLKGFDTRLFGDVAYNLQGRERAEDAAAGYAYYLANTAGSTISGFAPQRGDTHAYQVGIAVGSPDSLGMVYGTTSRRHGWELRAFWQRVEQYALDPNILDSDFFEGRANLQGIYVAAAYGLSANVIATARYGHADRINKNLGTGGSNQDIPQVNPIEHYDIVQLDLSMRF